MAANSALNLTSLDFDSLKQNLKTYLKSQSVFRDYDFEGSNINVLLDVLSYNTYLNSFYLNMVAAEGFLDSAQMRSSIVSHAKELNYTPASAKSARGAVNLTFVTTGITSNFEIPKGTLFSGRNANGTFTFVTNSNRVLTSTSNVFTVEDLEIYEGSYYNETFVVDYTVEGQKFVLANKNIDMDSVSVFVSDSNSLVATEYVAKTNLHDLNSSSEVYFYQATLDGYYEILFGDGVFGKRPINNSTVIVTYRVTNGDAANGVAKFSIDQNLGTYNGGTTSTTITTTSSSFGGAPEEDIESIRFRAPRHYQTQDRAVTAEDYNTIIFDNFGDIRDVHVYGGENTTGTYDFGKVFVAITSVSGAELTDQEKTDILTLLLKKRVMGIQPVMVNADYIYLVPTVTVTADLNTTSYNSSQLTSFVYNSIVSYNSANLQRFNTTFRFSKLVESIDNTDESILSNQTRIKIYKTLSPDIANIRINSLYTKFNNALAPGTIVSSEFVLSDGKIYVLTDYNPNNDTFAKSTVGESTFTIVNRNPIMYLREITLNDVQNYRTVGVVDYATGEISIQGLDIVGFYRNSNIEIYAETKSMDVNAKFNDVVEIDLAKLNISIVQA